MVRNLSAVFCQDILSDFSRILQESAQSMELQNKREWWNRREQIDAQLKVLLGDDYMERPGRAIFIRVIPALDHHGDPVVWGRFAPRDVWHRD